MTTYSVAEAKNRLPSLIDKALEGEEVIITRHGKPVVELHARTERPAKSSRAMLKWLLSRRHKDVGITSVELLNEMHDEADDR